MKIEREPDTQYIAFISYGKDSTAMLEAIHQLGWPLDRIITTDVWATDDIEADLPEMVEFKSYADREIEKRYGIKVEHRCAMKNGEKITYEKMFYHVPKKRKNMAYDGKPKGFPLTVNGNSYCKKLKYGYLGFPSGRDGHIKTIQYLGIAIDEPKRIKKHNKKEYAMPLVEIGWTESDCRNWCEENNLLSPIYASEERGGCWFCHNQRISSLRRLRQNHHDLWELLLKWDKDSPTTFHPDGHTVHDFDKRFRYEELGLVPSDRKFRWKSIEMLEKQQKLWR